MIKAILVFRKKLSQFNSIENVFDTLLPFFDSQKVELPYSSAGILPRIKNVLFLRRINSSLIHITGHDHYLLLFPLKKTILTIHDIEALNRMRGWKRYVFKKMWFEWPINNASMITTISEFSKSEIEKLGNFSTKIKVIYNPLTLSIRHIPKIFNKECPRILHIGMKENKNWRRLIPALNGINCLLILVGKASNEIINLLNTNNVNYELKTDISNQEVMEEYKKCDIVAFVSTYEGFGLPIIEGQALGRVILTSNLSSMPEVAGKGALFVNPFSVEEIREGIKILIGSEPLREDLIRQGLNNVERFKPKTIAEQYLKLYEEVLNN